MPRKVKPCCPPTLDEPTPPLMPFALRVYYAYGGALVSSHLSVGPATKLLAVSKAIDRLSAGVMGRRVRYSRRKPIFVVT